MSPTPPSSSSSNAAAMGAKKTTPPSVISSAAATASGRKSSPQTTMLSNAISSGTPTGRPPPFKRSSSSPLSSGIQINEALPPVAHVARQTLVARSVENVTVEEQEEEDQVDHGEKTLAQQIRRASDSASAVASVDSENAESSCILS